MALASVLRRRPEAYHEKLRQLEAASAGKKAKTLSPHEQMQLKETGLSIFLVYDRDERRSGLVRLLVGGQDVGNWARGPWQPLASTRSEVALLRSEDGLAISKRITVAGDRLAPTLTLELEVTAGEEAIEGELVLEWNLNLMGGGGNPAAHYRWGEEEVRHDSSGALATTDPELWFGNTYVGVDIAASAAPPAAREWYPVETVSNSEAGFERVYQGSCLTFRWPVGLDGGQSASFNLRFSVAQSTDVGAPSVDQADTTGSTTG